jgi:hypothetical protein
VRDVRGTWYGKRRDAIVGGSDCLRGVSSVREHGETLLTCGRPTVTLPATLGRHDVLVWQRCKSG